MTVEWVHPGLVLIVGAWVVPFVKGRLKQLAMVLLPTAALLICLRMEPGTYGTVAFLGQELVFGRGERQPARFGVAFRHVLEPEVVVVVQVEQGAVHVEQQRFDLVPGDHGGAMSAGF